MILPTTTSQPPEQIAGIEGTPYSKGIAIITFYGKRSLVSAQWNSKSSKHLVQAVVSHSSCDQAYTLSFIL